MLLQFGTPKCPKMWQKRIKREREGNLELDLQPYFEIKRTHTHNVWLECLSHEQAQRDPTREPVVESSKTPAGERFGRLYRAFHPFFWSIRIILYNIYISELFCGGVNPPAIIKEWRSRTPVDCHGVGSATSLRAMASWHCSCQQFVVATGAPAGSLGHLEEIDQKT